MSKKLLKGKDHKKVDIAKAAKEMEQNMQDLDLEADDYEDVDSDDEEHVPTFTPELAALKEKEMKAAGQASDEEMDSDVDMPHDANDDLPSHYSDSSEEKEDYTIRNSDSLIIAATAESDHSSLEVYLYDHKTSDLYVHHEILLGSYPLCMEWLGHW